MADHDKDRKDLKFARSRTEVYRTWTAVVGVLLQVVIIVKLFFFS